MLKNDIECIEADNRESDKRLLEVLNTRLKHSQPLTWGDIDEALRSVIVDKPRLADSLREIYVDSSTSPDCFYLVSQRHRAQ